MNIYFELSAHGSDAWKEAVALREKVLRIPLGSRFTEQELSEEANHFHVVGKFADTIIATAVLVPEGSKMKMQRVAVEPDQRNFGVGSRLMKFCESYAAVNNCALMYCHARDSAVNFYLKNDYEPDGDYFDEDGIPHLKMRKRLNSSSQ